MNPEYEFVTALADCTISRDGRAMSVLYSYDMRSEGVSIGRGYFGRIEYTEFVDGEAVAISEPIIAFTPQEAVDRWWALTRRTKEVYAPSVDRERFGNHDEGMSFCVALEALELSLIHI